MKKFKSVIMIILMIVCISNVSFAHGGNITGWKDKNSKNITEYNGKYYGYHKQNGEVHYHQVKWDEENQKWIIMLPAVYYDENFNKIEKDDELLQNLLVEKGLAENYMLQNNYKYAGMLQESEEIAKNNKLGIWSEKTNNIQNNENQIIESDQENAETNNLVFMIIGFIMILILSIFSIAYNTRKRK